MYRIDDAGRILKKMFARDFKDPMALDNVLDAVQKELELTYKLLFTCDRSSLATWYRRERKSAGSNGIVDPLLEGFCDKKRYAAWCPVVMRRGRTTLSFNARRDFPIFRTKLSRIQDHIDKTQMNSFAALWRDRRDLLRWYTFWAVVVLGGVNLFFGFTQTGLSAAQVQIAREALAAQLASMGNDTNTASTNS